MKKLIEVKKRGVDVSSVIPEIERYIFDDNFVCVNGKSLSLSIYLTTMNIYYHPYSIEILDRFLILNTNEGRGITSMILGIKDWMI